jgi:hypothetical protein
MRALAAAAPAALSVAMALGAAPARADGLTRGETDRLLRGETVARAQELRRGSRRYVGGVTYTIIDADPDEVCSLLDDVGSWRRFLPRTRDARRGGTVGRDTLVEVTHGSALVTVAYTLRVHREDAVVRMPGTGADAHETVVRFWVDRSRPHDIEDAWGFFRAEPMPDGRTLVTYGVLIDMGEGLLRDLFEDRVRRLALEVPGRVRDLAAEALARGRRAAR